MRRPHGDRRLAMPEDRKPEMPRKESRVDHRVSEKRMDLVAAHRRRRAPGDLRRWRASHRDW